MGKFDNRFWWDVKNNKEIKNPYENDDLSNIFLCKLLIDRIEVSPMTSENPNFDETMALKIINNIKNKIPDISNFEVSFSEKGQSYYINLIKNKDDKIQIVDQTNVDRLDKKFEIDDIKNFSDQQEANEKTTQKAEEKIQEENQKLCDKQDTQRYNKWFLDKFKFDKKEYENISEVKSSIDDMTIEEMNDFIENNMEDIDESFINSEIELDKSSNRIGKILHRQGMGDFFAIQSIIPDGNLRESEKMFNEIIGNLKKIYGENRKNFDNLIRENKNPKEINDYLAKMCVVYARFLNKWKSYKGNENVKDSKDYRNAMTSYFPEVISPFIFLYPNESCFTGDSTKSIELLKQKVGKNFVNSYISFPQSATQMLFDSVLYFGDDKENAKKFKCLRISVKGGRNGLGAKASISGLKSYFYDKENINLPSNLFSSRRFFDASLYSQYYRPYIKKFASQEGNEIIVKILSSLMLSNKAGYKNIIPTIYNSLPNEYKKEKNQYRAIQNFMNENKKFEECVLIALQYASYDFAQLNCLETPGDGDFHYQYSIQYPALFKGHINFELINGEKEHKLTFHIVE